MTAILENPLPILAIGVLSVAILIGGLVKTGRIALLYAIAVAIAMTAAMVFIERVVVTTKEEVQATLVQIADDLENGNPVVIASHIASGADNLRRDVDRVLPRVDFHKVKIKRNLELSFTNENALTASFNAVLVVAEQNGAGDTHHVPSYFVVDFVREGERWKVMSYDRRDPREGIR